MSLQMPRRVKYRKSQRGTVKGNATRGNVVSYGEYGLQALQPAWISARRHRTRPLPIFGLRADTRSSAPAPRR